MSAVSSHPLPAEDKSDSESSEERHKDEDVEIAVTQAPGYLCHIRATAKFPLSPDTLFRQVITHPNNEKLFRHMDRCAYRKILEDDGKGHQKVEVAHEASWRFLLFHGKFTTNLIVEQDMGKREMRFTLKPGAKGVMKKFVGCWQIEPHPQDPNACITHLDQDIALGIYVPPPLDRILKGISCSQVKRLFEDVKTEAHKINRGKPTLEPWDKVQLSEIGVDASSS